MALEDILKVLAESGTQGGGQTQASDNPLAGLLGSLLGGGSTSDVQSMGSDPLSALLGGGQASPLQALIQPIVGSLSKKLGIPPQIAMMVVTFAINYLISNHGDKLTSGKSLSGVIDKHTDQDFVRSSGLTQQLAQQTGMDPELAASSLSAVFSMLGAQTGSGEKTSSGRATASIKSQVASTKAKKSSVKSKSTPAKSKASGTKSKKSKK